MLLQRGVLENYIVFVQPTPFAGSGDLLKPDLNAQGYSFLEDQESHGLKIERTFSQSFPKIARRMISFDKKRKRNDQTRSDQMNCENMMHLVKASTSNMLRRKHGVAFPTFQVGCRISGRGYFGWALRVSGH
jgi:hypothetical protein